MSIVFCDGWTQRTEYRRKPRRSSKCLRFLVHWSAPCAIAHGAMTRSISCDLGLLTRLYRSAAVYASGEPNGRASSVSTRLSGADSSMVVLGHLRHSYRTSEGIVIRIPRSMAARDRVRHSSGRSTRQSRSRCQARSFDSRTPATGTTTRADLLDLSVHVASRPGRRC